MSKLNREWDEYVIAGNRISRDLENFDGVMKFAERPESKVVLHANGETVYIDTVLPEEVMGVLKTIVTNQLVDIRTAKEIELKKHMNAWKPAIINPEFEQAVKEMVQQVKPVSVSDPLEEKLAEILQKEEDRLGKQEVEAKMKQQSPLSPDDILRGDMDTVKKLFEDPSVKVIDIAEKYDVSKTNVYDFARRNHFSRAKKYVGFLDSPAVPKAPRKERP